MFKIFCKDIPSVSKCVWSGLGCASWSQRFVVFLDYIENALDVI